MTHEIRALFVHLFTATGAVFAMLAMLAAVDGKWDVMFVWLVIAFIVDGIDGPLARKYNVKKYSPQYDGYLLDLIIDYLTYVFIPAFALFKSGLFDKDWTGWVCIIVITFGSVIYFVDTRMKTKDNSFSGFPGCWNMVIALTVSMFLPVEFVHPVRTKRWRLATLPIALLWTACAGLAAWVQFDPGPVVLTGLALSSVYLLLAGICMQLFPQDK
jgi:phosphatidylcholine synthase